MSGARGSRPAAAHAEVGAASRTRTRILADLSDTRVPHEDPREVVGYGCARVHMYAYTVYDKLTIVYTFTQLHDRRIPKVRVGVGFGVGPMEFQL